MFTITRNVSHQMGRIPWAQVPQRVGGLQLRNRTKTLLSHRFITIGPMGKGDESKKRVAKWLVATSFTFIVSSYLINQHYQRLKVEEVEKDEKSGKKEPKIKIFNNNWLFFCYSTLPLNALSRLWGQMNSINLPIWVRPWSYKLYSSIFGADLNEMEDPDLTHYENLSQFFYRTIRPETRPIDFEEKVVVCPSDGKILQFGTIDPSSGEIEQVKGLNYSVKEFLGTHGHPLLQRTKSDGNLSESATLDNDHQEFARINNIPYTLNDMIGETPGSTESSHFHEMDYDLKRNQSLATNDTSKTLTLLSELSPNYMKQKLTFVDTKLYFAVIYLAPGDYHHYHSPVDWVCKIRRHFPGELFSVAPYFQRNFPNLFVLNERVALLGHWKHGFFSMTPVGATNVGSIKLNFDRELVTNEKSQRHCKPHTCYEATYENASKVLGGVPLIKGEEMGGFMLGSTVVLCFEAPANFEFNFKIGDKVKMGQPLGRITE